MERGTSQPGSASVTCVGNRCHQHWVSADNRQRDEQRESEADVRTHTKPRGGVWGPPRRPRARSAEVHTLFLSFRLTFSDGPLNETLTFSSPQTEPWPEVPVELPLNFTAQTEAPCALKPVLLVI